MCCLANAQTNQCDLVSNGPGRLYWRLILFAMYESWPGTPNKSFLADTCQHHGFIDGCKFTSVFVLKLNFWSYHWLMSSSDSSLLTLIQQRRLSWSYNSTQGIYISLNSNTNNEENIAIIWFYLRHPLKCVQWVVLLCGAPGRMFGGSPHFMCVFSRPDRRENVRSESVVRVNLQTNIVMFYLFINAHVFISKKN